MQNKTVLALVLLAAHCFGQSRMSVDVLRLLRGSPNKMVSLLVKGDAARIEGSAGRLGATYRYASGNISSLTLPVSSIRTLAMMPFVERIEIPRRDLRPLDDSSRRKNNILPVHAGAPPSTRLYGAGRHHRPHRHRHRHRSSGLQGPVRRHADRLAMGPAERHRLQHATAL